MNKILQSLLIIGIVTTTAFAVTGSFFSDKETSADNVFKAGQIDLKVNGLDNPDVLVEVEDLKPGDNYNFEKTLRVIDNDAFVWLKLNDYQDSQGTQTEPEEEEEVLNGEKSQIQEVLAYDLRIGEESLITLDDHSSLQDLENCWIPLGEFVGNEAVVVNQSFHMKQEVTNWAQGDSLTFSEVFYAEQVRHNQNPIPPQGTDYTWDPERKKCVPEYLISEDFSNYPTGMTLNGGGDAWHDSASGRLLMKGKASAFFNQEVNTDRLLVSFDFKIDRQDPVGADGFTLAFIKDGSPTYIGNGAGDLGYVPVSGDPPIEGFAVEFDVHNNYGDDQFSDNHVGLDLNGNRASVSLYQVTVEMEDNGLFHVEVSVTDGNHIVVYLEGVGSGFPKTKVIDYVVVGEIPADGVIGFTAGSGAFQDIFSVDNVLIDGSGSL